jgi:hypothetical protein
MQKFAAWKFHHVFLLQMQRQSTDARAVAIALRSFGVLTSDYGFGHAPSELITRLPQSCSAMEGGRVGVDVRNWPETADIDVHSNVCCWITKRTRCAHCEFSRSCPYATWAKSKSRNETYGNIQLGFPGSLHFRAREPNHLGPLRGFVCDELAEFVGRECKR